MMHDNLPPALEQQYAHSLRRFSTFEAEHVKKWSLFAGTGISSRFQRVLTYFWKKRYGVHIACSAAVMSEKDHKKQSFIKSQHPDTSVISVDVMHLSQSSAMDAWNGDRALLPPCGGMDIGLVCSSRTPLCSNYKRNVNCVQEERETTGLCWKYSYASIAEHRPPFVSVECVVGLAQVVPPNKSDAQWMCDRLIALGYRAFFRYMDSTDYASWVNRLRLWWAAFYGLVGTDAEITQWFETLIAMFKIKSFKFTADDFLVHDMRDRRAQATALRMPLISDFGRKALKGAGIGDKGYKLEHLQFFRDAGLTWPVEHESAACRSWVCYAGLGDRECDAAYFIDNVFAPQSPIEFCDINPTMTRMMSSCIDGEGVMIEGRSPWKANAPTQVGSGTMICRYLAEGREAQRIAPHTHGLRLLEPFESMRMIGWDDSFWEDGVDYMDADLETMLLLCNMAGNAYCAFHYLPWTCAVISTHGRFLQHKEQQEDGANDQGHGPNESDEGDADSVSPLGD